MSEKTDLSPEPPYEVEQLPRADYFKQVLIGIGVAAGMALLWSMEAVRNRVFAVLDALKVPARRRTRGDAFPPGKKRIHRSPS